MLSKKTIVQRIKKNRADINQLGIDLIGLFGSYVRDEQKESSDIDILVSFQEGKETFNNFMDLSYFLDDLFAGIKVEIVTTNGLNSYIGPKILKEVEYV